MNTSVVNKHTLPVNKSTLPINNPTISVNNAPITANNSIVPIIRPSVPITNAMIPVINLLSPITNQIIDANNQIMRANDQMIGAHNQIIYIIDHMLDINNQIMMPVNQIGYAINQMVPAINNIVLITKRMIYVGNQIIPFNKSENFLNNPVIVNEKPIIVVSKPVIPTVKKVLSIKEQVIFVLNEMIHATNLMMRSTSQMSNATNQMMTISKQVKAITKQAIPLNEQIIYIKKQIIPVINQMIQSTNQMISSINRMAGIDYQKISITKQTLPDNSQSTPVTQKSGEIPAPDKIFLTWKSAGVRRPTSLNTIFIEHMGIKYTKCGDKYIIICQHIGCGNLTDLKSLECRSHVKGKNIFKFCHAFPCNITPIFGFNRKEPLKCENHRDHGMKDVINKLCKYPHCSERAYFGDEIEKRQFCGTHKGSMVNFYIKMCREKDCPTIPSYGFVWGDPIACFDHKDNDMIDVRSKRCDHSSICYKQPSFGYIQNRPLRCYDHQDDDMYDVRHIKCEKPECSTRPSFGYIFGEPQYCFNHKANDMLDVVHKRCEYENCTTVCCFGYEEKKPHFCVTHKADDMIDVVHTKCDAKHCDLRPSYGYVKGNPISCETHKNDDMFNVVSKLCITSGCELQPAFRKLYCPTNIHCRKHATLNEYGYRKFKPLCNVIGCTEIAYFVDQLDPNIYPIRCDHHKFPTDYELVQQICPQCNDTVYYPKHKPHCIECGKYRQVVLYHFKELTVKYFLESNKVSFIYDRRISNLGSRFRPDFLIQTPFGFLIVEVDEYQHKNISYTIEGEKYRMYQVYRDIQQIYPNTKVTFIRYNPDDCNSYKCNNAERLLYLYQLIQYFKSLETVPSSINVMYLFYDGFDGTSNLQPLSWTASKTVQYNDTEPEIIDTNDDPEVDDEIDDK